MCACVVVCKSACVMRCVLGWLCVRMHVRVYKVCVCACAAECESVHIYKDVCSHVNEHLEPRTYSLRKEAIF